MFVPLVYYWKITGAVIFVPVSLITVLLANNYYAKKNVLKNPKQGIFYMTAEMPFKFVQSKVDFDYTKEGGDDCEHFSRGAMLRYMTYTNVHRCFYNKVKAVTKVRNLPLGGIVKGTLADVIAAGGTKTKQPVNKLPEYGYTIFNQITSNVFKT